jgi:hypothetical protein
MSDLYPDAASAELTGVALSAYASARVAAAYARLLSRESHWDSRSAGLAAEKARAAAQDLGHFKSLIFAIFRTNPFFSATSKPFVLLHFSSAFMRR